MSVTELLGRQGPECLDFHPLSWMWAPAGAEMSGGHRE